MKTRALCTVAAAAALVGFPTAGAGARGPHVTTAKHLHAGEFCSRSKQRYYHRHGFTCKRARDGRNRLFNY